MTILSAVFTTALNDVIHLHPVRGIDPRPSHEAAIITPEQFDQLHLAASSDSMKLLVEADIESGMRWVSSPSFGPGTSTSVRAW